MLTIAKRKKLREDELEQLKDNILNNLPVLDKRQIRRHRIPYHEALYLELIEDEFHNSAEFLKSLIDYQDKFFKTDEELSLIWNKPMLKDDKAMIEKLYEGLKAAELGIKHNQRAVEIDNLLELAIFYSNQSDAWWWLSEQLFQQCILSANNYYDDGKKRQAIINYIFGRFLLKQLNDVDQSKSYLTVCRELSKGQNWTATEVLKTHQGNLFKECCMLLYEGLLKLAEMKKSTNPTLAKRLCSIAHKRAIEANDSAGEAECLFQQGVCDMETEQYSTAIQKFSKVLIMHFSTNNKVGVCETRIHLALAHSKENKMTEAKYHLHHLLDYSLKHDMQYYNALAHRYLGELYLLHNIGGDAATHLLKALEIFHELDDYDNREQSKNLAAIATGLQLTLPLIKLIIACDRKNKNSLQNVIKLVRWKDTRVEFWDDITKKPGIELHSKYSETYGEFKGEQSELDYAKLLNNDYVSDISSDTTMPTLYFSSSTISD